MSTATKVSRLKKKLKKFSLNYIFKVNSTCFIVAPNTKKAELKIGEESRSIHRINNFRIYHNGLLNKCGRSYAIPA